MRMRHLAAQAVVYGLCLAFSAELLAQADDTRARREEIERLFQEAGEQGANSPSIPGDTPFSEKADAFVPAELDEERKFLWDVGGWARLTFTTFDTPVGQDRTLRDVDLRAWARVNYTQHHSVYGRVRSFVSDYNSGDAPGGDDDNWQELRVDQLYYSGNWARALDLDRTWDINVQAGRQFFYMGNGTALANTLEGVRVNVRKGKWNVEGILARTLQNNPDFDPSVNANQNEESSDRMFFGLTVSTSAFLERNFYAYLLHQADNNDLETPTQAFEYNSTYIGLGGRGDIPIDGLANNELSYAAEFIQQYGDSTASGSKTQEDISAYALMFDLYWLNGDRFADWFGIGKMNSRMVFSYYFGTGDSDRGDPVAPGATARGSQLGTVPGNRLGTEDNAFNYFGFVNTGFSLAPRLTNLHMLRFNYETTLMKDASDWSRSLKVGASLYFFFKHKADATITDFTSVESSRDVGQEIDLYADWSPASDLDIGARFGLFLPGGAYEEDDSRAFFSIYTSLSF